MASWRDGFVLPLDVWEARTAAASADRFVEAVGGGIIGTVIARDQELERPTYFLGRELDRALHLLREATRDVEIDAVDHSADLIGLEIMNGPYLGANIPLAPDAGPGDDTLDVVFMRADDRGRLLRRFETLATAQSEAPGALHVVKGHDVRIRPPAGVPLHLDGDSWVSADGWLRIVPVGFGSVIVGQRDDDDRVVRLDLPHLRR